MANEEGNFGAGQEIVTDSPETDGCRITTIDKRGALTIWDSK